MNRPLFVRLPERLQDSQLWSRLIVIFGVLLLTAFLARRPSEIYILLPLALVTGLILLRWPPLGLVSLLVGSLLIPFSIGTGTGTPLTVTMLLIPILVGVWLADMTRRHQYRLVPSSTTLPLLAFMASATVSLIAGELPWNSFARTAPLMTQLGGWAVFIFSAVTFLLTANQIDDQRWLKVLTTLFFVIGGLYMLGRVNLGLGRLSTMMNALGSDGSMFWVWLVALASGQLMFNRNLSRGLRLALALLVVATLGISWFLNRNWTSGYLPEVVAIGTILWLRSWRVGLLVTLAGVITVLVGIPHLLDSLVALKSYSIMTRDVAREILLENVLPLSPILGLGPANYYWYTPLYPILGYYVSFNSHNNYVDILMQTGLLGMACFLWVVWAVAWLGWRLRNSFANDFAQGYVYACLGGLAGTLVSSWLADWLLPFAYNIGLKGFSASVLAWLFLGGLVSLEQIARKSKTVDSD